MPLADGNTRMQAWMVTPPGFDEKKKYPALFWVHGGPQGAWEDAWSWRWNPEVLASAGYVVYLPNPRGSTGYGQPFVDGVSRDWGGKVYDDLMRGADDLGGAAVRRQEAHRRGRRVVRRLHDELVPGAHDAASRALFCHAGISNQEGQYATEELWFPDHEFGGPPWASEDYRKWNPMASADKFATPELVVHGERDYRIPVEQAYLMFTLLQRKGVPSKLLVFPDENHWVLKPGNSRLWYATMIDWFHQLARRRAGRRARARVSVLRDALATRGCAPTGRRRRLRAASSAPRRRTAARCNSGGRSAARRSGGQRRERGGDARRCARRTAAAGAARRARSDFWRARYSSASASSRPMP